jgi:hypothetical protein
VSRSPGLAEWSGRATAVAAAIAVLALTGSTLAVLAAVGKRSARDVTVARPDVTEAAPAGEALPSESDFPVQADGKCLLGAYLRGTSAAFVVLDTLRADRGAGLSPPPAGQDLFGVRLGVATDAEKPIDAKLFAFRLEDDSGNAAPSVTVATTGRLLPGPELSVMDVYFALDRGRQPMRLLIDGPRGTSLVLPAQPVRSEREAESEGR